MEYSISDDLQLHTFIPTFRPLSSSRIYTILNRLLPKNMINILDLPTELLTDILENLAENGPERLRIRLVCKEFWSIVEPSMTRFFAATLKAIIFSHRTSYTFANDILVLLTVMLAGRPKLGLLVESIDYSDIPRRICDHQCETNFGCDKCSNSAEYLPRNLSNGDLRLISAAVINAKLPGDGKTWLKELQAGRQPAYLKLLLTLVPNLKKLIVHFKDVGCLDGLNEISATVNRGEAQYLLHLEKLSLVKFRYARDEAMIWTLYQLPSLLRLPSLRAFFTSNMNIEDHCDSKRFTANEIDSNVLLNIRRLSFSNGFISPTFLAKILAACPHLQDFAYRADDVHIHDKWTKESQFEPAELTKALQQHKRMLETLSIPDFFSNCISSVLGGLYRSDDLTFGSLADFSTLKHLVIEQVVLLGDPDTVDKFIPCLGVHGNISTKECRCGPVCRWRRPRSYRLRDVLPSSIQRLEIRKCNKDISGDLLELAEVQASEFPHLAIILLTCDPSYHNVHQISLMLYNIRHAIRNAFGPTVSLDVDARGRYE